MALKRCVIVLAAVLLVAGLTACKKAEQTAEEKVADIIKTGKYGEAPMLAAMVKAGELPPVKDRLPEKPLVVEPIEAIGRYGGELNVFATKEGIGTEDLQGMFGTSFFRQPRSGVWIEPDVAEGWEINEDKTAITVFMRKGMKWSDGEPLTSEDVRFTFEDMHFNPSVATWGSFGIDAVEVIDEYAIKLINNEGLGTNPLQMSAWFGGYATSYHPAHYLKKWHIDYNPDADTLAKEEGFDDWYAAMREHYWWWPLKDPDKPQVEPWQLVQYGTSAKLFERNPYFHRVDQEGNQLPYIDRLMIQFVDPETYQLKVSGGGASIAYEQTKLENLALYKQGEEAGDYRVILHPGTMGSYVKLVINQNHPDPALRDIYSNVKFRQALSVSIDREEVNEVIYNGLGVPGQCAPLKSVSFYKEGWREYYAQYDPELANQLLDEIGLDKRDSNGFRKRPDGQTLSLVIEFMTAGFASELELVKEYFEDVGLKTTIKLEDGGLLDQRIQTSEYFAHVTPEPNQPWCSERQMFQLTWVWMGEAGQAVQWNNWIGSKERALTASLEEGEKLPPDWRRLDFPEGAVIEGEEPPMYWIEQDELENGWNQMQMGSPEYEETGQKVFDFYVQRLTRIGIVGEVPSVMLAKNKLGNVIPPGWVAGAPIAADYVQTWMDQMYWKE